MSGYLCGVCKKDEKFDPSWTRHLASLCHQRALSKLADGGHAALKNYHNRSARIVGSEGFCATLIQFVEYLTQNGGELQEFICPPGVKPIVAHCLFKEAQSLENLLKVKDPKLFDQKMDIMRNDVAQSKKRKVPQEEEGTKTRCFNGLPIEAQLDKCIEMFGWSGEFISEAQKFVNEVVGKLNMKYRKIPFGDLVTGLGLHCRPVLQLLFDVQDIFESNPDKVKSLLHNCHLSIQASRTKSPQKTFPLKKTWIVDKELCIQSVVCNSTTTLRLRYSNALEFEECRLFKFYCQFDARILPITFLLAHWATSNSFLQTTNQAYPNQLIILMTICFLQHKKVLPTVQNLQEHFGEEEKPIIINGNVVSFCSDADAMKKVHPNPMASLLKDDGIRAMSLLGLLKDWFDYFSTVDLKENAICSRFGYFIPKQDFHPSSVGKLPGDLARVYRFGMGASNSKKDSKEGITTKKFLFTQSPLCIQNPFDLSINCSRGVTSEEVCEFQTGCKEAVKIVAELLISDEPDLTEFILKSVPNFQEIFGNDLKKVKTEPASSTTVTPQKKPIYSVPSTTPSKPITHSTSKTTEIQAKASAIKIQPKDVSVPQPTSLPTPTPLKSRPGAADFFSKTETEDNDNDDRDIDEEDEDDDDDDGISVSVSGASVEMNEDDTRDCTLTLNKNLFNYFARTFQGTTELKHDKLQLLVLQFILDFNQKFWTNCFGLVFEPKVGQKFWSEDFAQIHYRGAAKTNLTTIQRILAISSKENNEINVDFRVRSDGKMIHKIFTEPPENLTVKKWCSNLTNFSLPLYSEVPPSRLQEIKDVSYLANQTHIQFECRLIGAISKYNGQSKTPLATLQMSATSDYGQNHAKINIIKKLYRKLGQSYIDKMVKRWLAEGKDFDETKAQNFVQSQNQKWNAKRNRKAKQKQQQKQDPSSQNIANKVSNSASYSQLLKAPSSTIGNTTRFAFPNMNFRPQFNSPTTINQSQQQFSPPRPLINPGLVDVARSRFGGRHYTSEYQQQQQQPQEFRYQLPYSTQKSQGTNQQIQYQPQQQQHYQQTQSYYKINNNNDANERILRNPGPQGMRTFFTPKERPSHPLEYNSCFNQNNETCDQKNSEYSNPQLPFQDRKSTGNTREDLGSNNDNYSSFNNTTTTKPQPLIPNLKKYSLSSSPQYTNTNLSKPLMSIPPYDNSKPIKPLIEDVDIPKKLFPNPRYNNSQPEPLFKNEIPSLFPNPKFNRNPPPPLMSNQREYYQDVDNNYSAANDRYENYGIQRQNTSQMTANPIRENNSRLQRQAPEELFTRRPDLQDFRYDVPTSNYPNVKKSPSKLIPLIDFDDDPRMRQYPTHGRQQQQQQQYSSNYNQGQRQQRANSPPYVRSSATQYTGGFVRSGFLTNQQDDEDDDELDIEYDLDPRSCSSPPPEPPIRNFKLGNPFPVPKRPTGSKSPISYISRNATGYQTTDEQREGYRSYRTGMSSEQYDLDTDNNSSENSGNIRSGNNFEGFGTHSSFGISSFNSGRKF